MKPTALLLDLMNLGPLGLSDVIRTVDGHYLGRRAGEPGYNAHIGQPKAAPGPGQDRSRRLWESWSLEERAAVTLRALAPPEGQPIPLEDFGITPDSLPAFTRYDVTATVDRIEVDAAGEYIPDSVKELYHEPLRRFQTEAEADALVNAICREFKGAAAPAHGYDTESKPQSAAARLTLDAIHRLMDGQEWDSSTSSAISELLAAAGYTIREPNEPDPQADPQTPNGKGGK